MTTATYSTPWSHTTLAGFVGWGQKLSQTLQAVGLAQTSDTGQINWATISTLPAASTVGGYEIYAFTDTLQTSAPVYLKIEYGTGAATGQANGAPAIWITVGTGTNGAGTLSGTVSTRYQIIGAGTANEISNSTTPYPTYICFNGSYLGVLHKVAGYGWPGDGYVNTGGVFMIGRETNTSGAYVAGGIVFVCNVINNSSTTLQATMQCMNTTNSTLWNCTNGTFTCAWFSPSYTSVGQSTFQLYPCWAAFNQVTPINWLLYGLNAEIQQGTTVLATPFGTTQHTYLMTGSATYGWGVNSGTGYSALMLWE